MSKKKIALWCGKFICAMFDDDNDYVWHSLRRTTQLTYTHTHTHDDDIENAAVFIGFLTAYTFVVVHCAIVWCIRSVHSVCCETIWTIWTCRNKHISHSCKFTFPYKSRFDGFLACATHQQWKSERQTPSKWHFRNWCNPHIHTHTHIFSIKIRSLHMNSEYRIQSANNPISTSTTKATSSNALNTFYADVSDMCR